MKLPRLRAWWPGLVRLWRRGDLLGLAVAMGFAALVNLALLATFIWPEATHPLVRWFLWGAVLFVWGKAFYRDAAAKTGKGDVPAPNASGDESSDLFRDACREYLRGEWDATEKLIARLLAANPFDVEARLLWATLLRHRGQRRLAVRQLRRLERFEAAEKWSWEIQQEWRALRTAPQSVGGEGADSTSRGANSASEAPSNGGTHHLRRAA